MFSVFLCNNTCETYKQNKQFGDDVGEKKTLQKPTRKLLSLKKTINHGQKQMSKGIV